MNYYAIERTDNSLRHYGVQGQKWGRRNYQNEDGSYTELGRQHYGYGNGRRITRIPNSNYSMMQRIRDRSLYGRGGVKRINKEMNRGNSISGARSLEAHRIRRARESASTAARVGSVAGSIGGAVYGGKAIRGAISVGSGVVTTALTRNGELGVQAARTTAATLSTPMSRLMTDYGGAVLGSRLGQRLGRNGSMRINGYSPKLY